MAFIEILMKRIKNFIYVFFLTLSFHVVHANSLQIGTISDNPPFEILVNNSSGEFFGFDIELMEEICRRIRAECSFKSALFEQLPEMINNGEIDLAIAAIIITPERRQRFLFSIPYKESDLQYVTLTSSPLKTVGELTGKTVGTYLHSPANNFTLQQFGNNIQLQSFRSSIDMFDALNNHQVSAVITNPPQAIYWVSNDSRRYKLLGEKFPIGEGYGIMTKLGRDDLILQINKALDDMEKDGTYLSIYERSFN